MFTVSKRTASVLQKTFAALTVATTVMSLAGFAFVAKVDAAVPSDYGLKEGDTISAKGSSDPDVYIVNALGYKRLFLNPVIFSFYGHLGGFAAVKSVSAAARDAFPTSGLFRNCETNDQKVYGVEVNGEDTGMFHWVNVDGATAVSQDANFFKKVFCINNNEFNWYPKGSVYTSVSQVPNYTRGPGPGPSGPVTASLSPDNPVAATVVATQGVADLAHFRLSSPGGSVAVTSLQFKRIGISGDSAMTNTYVFGYDAGSGLYGVRLTDSATPSTGLVNVNGGTSTTTIITVPAGGYVDIAFRTDIADNTSGQTIGVQLTAVNGVSTSVSGNVFTIAAKPSDLATAQFAAAASLIPATAGVTSDPLKDTIVWQDTLTVGNKNLLLRRFSLRQTNSINPTDVNNFRLFVDGVQVAQVQNLDSNGYANFLIGGGTTILTGSRTIKVLADIVGGTSRKLTMSLRSTADAGLLDSNYSVGVTATLASGTFPLTAGDITINAGSIVAQKDVSAPSGNVVKGASDQILGRWLLTAYGEPVKVSTLIVGLVDSNASVGNLRNGRVMAYATGNPSAAVQYGSTSNLAVSGTASTSYTVNLTVNPGSPQIVEARADIFDNDGADSTTAGDTITSKLYVGASNGQGMVSLATSNVPTATTAANQLTVQSGSISISQYAPFPAQTITTPATNRKIGSYVVTGSINEAVNVNTLTLDVAVTGAAAVADLSNVYIKFNGVPTSVKSSITATGNSYSISNTQLAVNGSVLAEVYADITNRSSGTYQSKLLVAGTTVTSAAAVSTNGGITFTGQLMTIGAGSIASALAANTPVSQLVSGNSSVDVARFNFLATNDTFNITELQFKTLASLSEGGIANVSLKKADGTVVATLPLSKSGNSQFATFGSLTGLSVPANDPNGLTLTAAVQTGNVGIGAASTALNVGLTLDYFKNTNSAGTLATDLNDRVGNNNFLHASVPTVTAVTLPATLLTNGTQTFAKFSIVGTPGTIGWNKIKLNIAKSSGPTFGSGSFQLFENGVDISSQVQFTVAGVGTGFTSGTVVASVSASPFERQVPSTGLTYEFKANITNTIANDSIAVSFNTPSANAVPNAASVVRGTTATLVWSDRVGNMSPVVVHSATTADWMNDNLVKTLPFTQSLSR